MPGLISIDPQGELVRRIAALEAEQRRIATLRREPAVNLFAVKDSSDQVIGATLSTKITGWNTYYTNPADSWDAANSQYTPESPGMYLVIANVVWRTGTAVHPTLLFFSETTGGYLVGAGRTVQAGETEDSHLACITQLDGATPFFLTVYRYVAGGTILGAGSTLQIHRLSDMPANTL